MSLQDELNGIAGKKRRFLLMRIADIDADEARTICGVPKGTYSTWLFDKESKFAEVYRRVDELSVQYKREAISLIRRDNQLTAVFLEEKIIEKMREEIETGEYNLIKTKLAVEVYSKLISDLDYQPQVLSLSWEERLTQLFNPVQPVQITGGEHAVIEATGSQPTEYAEGTIIQESEQVLEQAEEETQEGSVECDLGVLVDHGCTSIAS